MSEAEVKPRVCACVMMNHPFPGNIPLLRKIYADRFSTLRFIIPFERMPDEDVITVYRGSYTHAGYLADAHHILSKIDCDYYLIIHDDVLLTPTMSEDTFRDYFPIGPDDGFIPGVGPTPDEVKAWGWMFGMLPKLLFPKSQLFGSGIELANLLHYLPGRDKLLTAMRAAGVEPRTRVSFDPDTAGDPHSTSSRFLLHGLAADIPVDAPLQSEVEEASSTLATALIQAMLKALQLPPFGTIPAGQTGVDLPIPLVTAGYATDFYILPKSGFDDFCHYLGIASAANLFVEIIAPTLLYACCGRVWQCGELGLDFSGFAERKRLGWFAEPKAVAMHPVKISQLLRSNISDDLLLILRALQEGERVSEDRQKAFGFSSLLAEPNLVGWHHHDPSGVWAASVEANIPIIMSKPAGVRLTLTAPIDGNAFSRFTGRLRTSGQPDILLDARSPHKVFDVRIPCVVPDNDGVGRVTLVSDRLISPVQIDPRSGDTRNLGFAVNSIEKLEPCG